MKQKITLILVICAINLLLAIIVLWQIFNRSQASNTEYMFCILPEIKSSPTFFLLFLQGQAFSIVVYSFLKNEFTWLRKKFRLPRHIYNNDDTGEMIISRLGDIVNFPILALLISIIILSQISIIERLNLNTFIFYIIILVDFAMWFAFDSFLNKREYFESLRPNDSLSLKNQYGG